jgi:hypothetical protein
MTLQRDGNKVYWSEGSGENGTATITEAVTAVAESKAAVAKRERVAASEESSPKRAEATGFETAVEPEQSAELQQAAEMLPPGEQQHAADMRPAAVPQQATEQEPPAEPSKVRFATAALDKLVAAIKPIDEPVISKLGATAPAADAQDAPVAQRAEPVTAPPLPARSERRKAPVVAARKPKAPAVVTRQNVQSAKQAQLFRVAGVELGDKLYVRSGPSEFHPAVGGIPSDGRKVKIIGECRELWCPVRHGSIVGWVNRYYLAEEVASREAARNSR